MAIFRTSIFILSGVLPLLGFMSVLVECISKIVMMMEKQLQGAGSFICSRYVSKRSGGGGVWLGQRMCKD